MNPAIIGAIGRNLALDIEEPVHATDTEVELDKAVFAGKRQAVLVDDGGCGHRFVEQPAVLDLALCIGGEERLLVDVEPEELLTGGMPERALAQLAFAVDEEACSLGHALAPLS